VLTCRPTENLAVAAFVIAINDSHGRVLEKSREAALALAKGQARDPSFRGIFPDQLAPIVRDSVDGERELVMWACSSACRSVLPNWHGPCSGALADRTSFAPAYQVYAYLPAIGILAAVLSNPPNLTVS
jgi:hypothetical protein